MKIHYMGKFDLNPDSLPHGEHKSGAVKFKEPKDSKTLGLVASGIGLVLVVVFGLPIIIRSSWDFNFFEYTVVFALLAISLPIHELLHAICFKKDAYVYTNLRQGMLFVVGPEDMSKGRFVFMSLLPSIIFAFIPYIVAIIFPQLFIVGVFAVMSIACGAGDYLNVFNALTQMPKGARTYLHKINSYWYMP